MIQTPANRRAVRARIVGAVQGVGFREATRRKALALGVLGWVRNADDGAVVVHAEGPADAVDALLDFLRKGPRGARVETVELVPARIEGHEQFAIRGVLAGAFVVQQHRATAPHYDLRLEVDGVMRSWAVPKGPSLDPAVKRLAVQVPDHEVSYNDFEGRTDDGAVIVWDRGGYEQGGRVPWPEALRRGHAVFVLHGQKLRGGFALQRTGPAGPKAQWLLIKRRDEHARPGSDIVAERPASVLGGRTLAQLLSDSPPDRRRKTMDEKPTLYVCHGDEGGPRLHPCRRVQEAMHAKGIAYDKVVAAHGSPIPFLRKGSREELREATGDTKLPALKLPDGTVLKHSRAIKDWIARQG